MKGEIEKSGHNIFPFSERAVRATNSDCGTHCGPVSSACLLIVQLLLVCPAHRAFEKDAAHEGGFLTGDNRTILSPLFRARRRNCIPYLVYFL